MLAGRTEITHHPPTMASQKARTIACTGNDSVRGLTTVLHEALHMCGGPVGAFSEPKCGIVHSLLH